MCTTAPPSYQNVFFFVVKLYFHDFNMEPATISHKQFAFLTIIMEIISQVWLSLVYIMFPIREKSHSDSGLWDTFTLLLCVELCHVILDV